MRSLHEEMVAWWEGRTLPAPFGLPLDEDDRGYGAGRVMLALGWTAHVVASARVFFALDSSSYGANLAPILRSMAEHVIDLGVLRTEGEPFIDVVLAEQAGNANKLLGRRLDGDPRLAAITRQLLEDQASLDGGERGREKRSEFRTVSKRAIAAGLEELLPFWTAQTRMTHPSMSTAVAYFVPNVDGTMALSASAPKLGAWSMTVANILTHAALREASHYLDGEGLDGVDADWTERLREVDGDLEVEIAARLLADDD